MKANSYQDLIWSVTNPFYKAVTNEDTFKQLQLVTITLGINATTGTLAREVKNAVLDGEMNDVRTHEKLLKGLGYTLAFVTCASKLLGCPLEKLMDLSAENFKEKGESNE